jgi:hypothetical protein
VLRSFLVEQAWFGPLLVAGLSLLDYRLSVVGLRWYRQGADRHYDLEGSYELNPPFETDVEALRPVSPKHLIAVVRMVAIILAAWFLTVFADRWQGVYVGVVGFFVLTQVPAHIRHIQNIALFRFVALRGGVQGKTLTPRWMDLQVSGVLFWSFAAVYALLWVLLDEPFLAGGAVGAALAGARFWIFGQEAASDEGAR